jgi:hypothetical protein
MEIGADLGRQQDGCACIDEMKHLNYMLLFPRRIGGNARNTFEVHLNFFKRSGALDRSLFARLFLNDTIVLPKNLPDGACGSGKCLCSMLKPRIARQIIQNGSWSWDSLKILRGSITNSQNPLFYLWISLWVWRFTPKRLAE